MVLKHEHETNMLLCLMRAALNECFEEQIAWDPACDAAKLEKMILRQSLVTIVYPVIVQQNDAYWKNVAGQLKTVYEREIHRGMIQEYEFQALLDDMEKDGIDCLPMKGWIMRNYYPDPLMRSMGDLDVLIKDMDSQKMQAWMRARKYTPDNINGDIHDQYWKQPYTYIELHYKLINREHLRFVMTEWVDELEQRVWRDDTLVKGKRYTHQLRDEDFYIYHLLHFYKHFIYCGTGIRPLADIYVFMQQLKLDRSYLEHQLRQLNIFNFAVKMEKTAKECFGAHLIDGESSEIVKYLTDTGIYGNKKTAEALQALGREKSAFKKNVISLFLVRTFPSLNYMRRLYPNLKKVPWLLPFYWVARLCRIAFFERYKVSSFIRNAASKENYDDAANMLHLAGIKEKEKNT